MSASVVRKRERGDLIKLTVFLVVAALFTVWVAAITSEFRSGGDTTYRASFEDVSGLEVGDQVRVAGVIVGKVQKIDVQPDNTVLVSFTVADSTDLNTSTNAAIEYRNLIGDRIVQLSREDAAAPPLTGSAIIPASQTESALDLDTLLNGFKPLFAGLNPGQVNELSQELIQVLQGQESSINTLVQRIGSFTTTIGEREALIGQVIGNLNTALTTFDDRRQTVGLLIERLDTLVTGLDRQDTQLLVAADQIDVFARQASDLVRSARLDLNPDLRELARAARGLNLESETLERVLQQLPRHYRKIQNTGSYGNYFNFFLCGVRIQTGNGSQPTITPWINSDAARCQR
jgi:phospholipid/cholesterol/gamma-HCH transport system substrate-binding protein